MNAPHILTGEDEWIDCICWVGTFVVFSCSDFSAFSLPDFFRSMKSVWTVGMLE